MRVTSGHDCARVARGVCDGCRVGGAQRAAGGAAVTSLPIKGTGALDLWWGVQGLPSIRRLLRRTPSCPCVDILQAPRFTCLIYISWGVVFCYWNLCLYND